jgi:hypothetical protein
VFSTLLSMVPGLEERLMEGSDDDLVTVAEMACGTYVVGLFFPDAF